MNMCWCFAIPLVVSALLLGSSCTAVERDDNDSLNKLQKHNIAKGSQEPLLTDDGPFERSHRRRPRELAGRDKYTDIKDAFQELSITVKGIQGEYGILDETLSKQRIRVEKMEENLLAVQNDINEIERNILLGNDTMGRLTDEVQAVENDTRKLEATVSNINIRVQQLLRTEEETTVQISKLGTVTSQLISAVSLESLNKTIQDLMPAAVMSNTDDLRQQISELKSALESNRATHVVQSATMKCMDGLQEALRQISELREKCVSKEELNQLLQNITSVREVGGSTNLVNKCSVNVRHEPRDGRTHLRLVMDPTNTDTVNCK